VKLMGIQTCACDCPELISSSTVPASLSSNDSPTFEVNPQARPEPDRAFFDPFWEAVDRACDDLDYEATMEAFRA
jgi:hypothetical protein